MNDILKYFVNSLSNNTRLLKKKGIIVEKPWALIDEGGEMQKFIFRKNGELIISKNGEVYSGSWEYFPEAQSLLINRGFDKLLLKEIFIDESIIIMKKDGTEDAFCGFANENLIPDLNIPKYLNDLKCKKYRIKQVRLSTGNTLQIRNGDRLKTLSQYSGSSAEIINQEYRAIEIPDGDHITHDKKFVFRIINGKIMYVTANK